VEKEKVQWCNINTMTSFFKRKLRKSLTLHPRTSKFVRLVLVIDERRGQFSRDI